MLQEKLKAATQPFHDKLEQLMFVNDIMNKTLTKAQYQELLKTNFIVHQKLEPAILAALSEETATKLNINGRKKIDSLLLDLQQEGLELDNFEHMTIDTSFIDSEASAIGAMYVLEGATLGGNVIYKKLKSNPNIEETSLLHYYSVYKDQLLPNWTSFIAELNGQPENNHSAIIAAATKTFETIAAVSLKMKH